MNLITVDPSSDFSFLQDEIFDFGAMVPNQVFKLLEQPSGKEKLENIRILLVGGSAISSAMEAQISQLSNRVVLTYGMTETASHIAIREFSGARKSEFYRCLPGISVSLNESGCLQIHLPELEKPLQTNDLAEPESGSCFKITGRADSVIMSGGIKYSPEAIEKKLEGLFNQRFLISSVPDEKLGEKLVLVIEGEPFDTKITEQRLALLLTPYQQMKTICFIEQFPETNTGKVLRSEIKTIIRGK
jgi:O-succinylbenzoic acid--CoA ligase